MRKKWIVIPSLLVLTVVGGVAATPLLRPAWERLSPPPQVVVDGAMRQKTIDTLVAKLNDHYVSPTKPRKSKLSCVSACAMAAMMGSATASSWHDSSGPTFMV